ncbi:MAG: hypothetical protein M3M98_03540 [Nitrospirota bacterium]|nr:hypothetical protein [Nitrospirota bacterium]
MIRLLMVPLVMLLTTDVALAITPALTLILAADKTVYTSGDRIALTIRLENMSAQPLTINRRLAYPGPDLTVEITDPRGVRLRWLPPSPPPPVQESDFVQLHPGQQFQVRFPDIGRHLFDKLERAGDYQAKAMYRNTDTGAQWNSSAWTGSLESPVIIFRWGG